MIKRIFSIVLILSLLALPLAGAAGIGEATTANIVFAGDLLCLAGQLLDANTGTGWEFGYAFDEIAPYIEKADFAVGNLETPIAGEGKGLTEFEQEGNPIINAPYSFADGLAHAGFDMVVTANNHAFDKGYDGATETIRVLNQAGIYHTGSYTSQYMKNNTPIVRVSDIPVAILSYTQYINQSAGAYRSSAEQYRLNQLDVERIKTDIAAARERNAQFVIVYVHWGEENVTEVNGDQKIYAKEIAQAGADVIIGSHPHAIQPVEFLNVTVNGKEKEVLVAYSLGNFVSSMERDINNDGILLNLEIARDNSGTVSLKKASYLCTTVAPSGGKKFVVLPSRATLNAGVREAQMQASIDRTNATIGGVIEEIK